MRKVVKHRDCGEIVRQTDRVPQRETEQQI